MVILWRVSWTKWRRKWQPILVLLPGKSHGQRSLVGYSPWGRKVLDMNEQLYFTHFILYHWRRKWQPTPVFLPGESHGQRSLAGHGPRGHRESDTTDVTKHAWTKIKSQKTKFTLYLLKLESGHFRANKSFIIHYTAFPQGTGKRFNSVFLNELMDHWLMMDCREVKSDVMKESCLQCWPRPQITVFQIHFSGICLFKRLT